jgi:hypothetical protein
MAAGAVTFGRLLVVQAAEPSGANAAQASSTPKPPYLISVTDSLSIVFEADESALKSLLPPNIKPAASNTGGLNMYQAAKVLGLVPYTCSYLWIDIDGFDSPDGTKGRWPVQGWLDPEPVPTAFKSQLGFSTELGVTRFEHEGNRIHATLSSNGANLLDATIALKEGSPSAAGGLVNEFGSRRNLSGGVAQGATSDIVVNRVPYTAEVSAASPVSSAFHFRTSDAVKVLQPKRLLAAFHFNLNPAVEQRAFGLA